MRRILPGRASNEDRKTVIPRYTDNSGYTTFFTFYGVDINQSSHKAQLVGTCPFFDCMKPNHFYANKATGQWDCKVCGKNGNTYTFINLIYTEALGRRTDKDITEICNLRKGIDRNEIIKAGLCFNLRSSVKKEIFLPAFSNENKLLNLYTYKPSNNNEMSIYSGPTLSQLPYLLNFYNSQIKNIWLAEGHWDALSLKGVFSTTKDPTNHNEFLINSNNVLGCPGTTYPRNYLSLLDNKNVHLLFDNDTAGAAGIERIIDNIKANNISPNKIFFLSWPKGLKDGFDIRDLSIVDKI